MPPHARERSHWRAPLAGKARTVGPGARRPPTGRQPIDPRGKGEAPPMNSRTRAGILAASLGVLALTGAAPALAAPSDVTVRVEGAERTLVPRTAVTTTTDPV